MEFLPHVPPEGNAGERAVYERLRRVFQHTEGFCFYRFPMFREDGRLHCEPDFVVLQRDIGLWVLECKGFYAANLAEICGHAWKMRGWYRETETPVRQALDAAFALKQRLEREAALRGRVQIEAWVVLPFVKRQEWQALGLADLEGTRGVVLCAEDLTPTGFRAAVERAGRQRGGRLGDEAWAVLKGVLLGPVRCAGLRETPVGASVTNPAASLRAAEGRLSALDPLQHRVAFSYPDGPQRIRGLAGCGKTLLLCRRAAAMHPRHPDWKIALVFFTRSLRDQIEALISGYLMEVAGLQHDPNRLLVLPAWGNRDEMGFYRLTALAARQPVESPDDSEREQGRRGSPQEAFEWVCERLEGRMGELEASFDAILIDEGQDLPPAFYRIAYRVLKDPKRLYWAYDEAQGIGSLMVPQPLAIFGSDREGRPRVDLGGKAKDGSGSGPMYEGGIPKAINMNRCYRTPRLLLMAAHAVNMGLVRDGGPLQGIASKEEWKSLGYEVVEGDFSNESVSRGSMVTLTRWDHDSPHLVDEQSSMYAKLGHEVLSWKVFDRPEAEATWLAESISRDLAAGLMPDDILVCCLVGDGGDRYMNGIAAALRRRGIGALVAGVDSSTSVFREAGKVTIGNVHRCKGNDAWKVYASRFHCALVPLDWRQETELHKRNEAFVALTRSRMWCVVTGMRSRIFEELEAIVAQQPYLRFKAFSRRSLRRLMEESMDEPQLF